jgi:hypothetical protein
MNISRIIFLSAAALILNVISVQAQVPSTNLELHLKPDAGVTLSDGKLSEWTDQSGNGNHAEQTTVSNRPVIESGVFNGYDALYFDGVDDYINLPTPTSLNISNSSYEIFIVMESKLSNTDVEFVLAGASEHFELHTNGSGGMRYIPRSSQYIDAGTAGDFTDQNIHLINLRATGSNAEIVMDKVTSQSSGASGLSNDNTQLRIGARANNSLFFDGYIAEVIIYSTTLSTTDRTAVEDYLDTKYFASTTSEPTANPSSVSFENISGSNMTVRIDKGDGQRRLVLVKEGSAVDAYPSDNTSYTSDLSFESGAQIGTGNYVVYNGSDSVITINGLTPGTNYHVGVVELNGEPGSENYRTSDPQTGSVTTSINPPEIVDVSLTSLTSTSVTVNAVVNPQNSLSDVYVSSGTDPTNFSDSTFIATVPAGTTDVSVDTDLTGLDLTNTLYYRISVLYGSNRVFSRIYAVRYKDQISGNHLALWASADAVPTADTDGDALNYWEDISGNHHDIVQESSSSQPKWYDNVVNGKPVIRFDGGDELLTPKTSVLGLQNSDYEIFVVSKTSDTGVQFLYSAAEGIMETHLNGGQGIRFIPTAENYLDTGSDLAYSDGNAHIIHNRATSTEGVARADSTTGVVENANYNSSVDQDFHIGRRATSVFGFNGDIAEILIFKSALTNEQYNAVADYLEDKYALTGYNRVVPETAGTGFVTSDISDDEATLTFTPGNGSHRLIAVRKDGAVDADPPNFKTYTANSVFGSGAQIGTGNYAVYNGTGNEVTITGLELNSTYHVEIFEYNSTVSSQYQTASTLTGSFTTLNYTDPIAKLGEVSNLTATTTDVGISVNPQGDQTSYRFLYGTDQNFSDTTAATVAGSTFTSTDTDISLSGLTSSTLYYTKVMAYNTQGDTVYSETGTFRYQEDIPSDSLSFWLDAGTGVQTSGTDVTAWYDLSGAFNNATPGSVNPELQSSVINSKPAVNFAASGTYLYMPKTGEMNLTNSEYEFFAVLKSNTTGYVFSGRDNNSFSLNMNSELIHKADQVHLKETDTSLFRNDNTFLANGHADNSGAYFNVNYVTSATQTGDYRFTRSTERIRINRKDSTANDGFDGQLAEMIVYHRKLTVQERKDIHTYLSDKYGLNLNIATPTVQVSNLAIADTASDELTITFSPGNGSSRLLLVKEGAAVDETPSNGTTYSPNTVFGDGTEIGTGNFVVAAGKDTSITITGLSTGTTYHMKAFEYSGVASDEQYLLTGATDFSAVTAALASITNIEPERNSHTLATDSDISVTFSQALNTGSVNDDTNFRVLSSTRGHLPGTFSFSNANQTVTYTPDADFKPGEELTVSVNNNGISFASPATFNSENIEYKVKTNRSTARFDSSRVQTSVLRSDSFILHDINDDGWNDVIGPTGSDIVLYQNDQDSTYTYSLLVDDSDATLISAGDINNDGYTDIVYTLDDYEVKVYHGQSNGSFTHSEDLTSTNGDINSIDLLDMNGDGWLDMVLILDSSSKTVNIWHNEKDGTFVDETTISINGYVDYFTSADYNNDGITDLAMIEYTSEELHIISGTDSSSYTVQETGSTIGNGTYNDGIISADLNNDNYMDIVVIDDQNDKIVVYTNDGDNTFSSSDISISRDPDKVKVGDVNGDGNQDLLVLYGSNTYDFEIGVYKGKGDGTVILDGVYSTQARGDTFELADMNGDGTLDIVVISNSSGSYGLRTIYNTPNSVSEVTLTGSEGWRLMASPFTDASYATTFDGLWTQGITGSDTENGTENIYTWGTDSANSNVGNWKALTSMSDSLKPGSGALAYVYSDDNGPESGDAGFPKTLSVDGTPNETTLDLSSTLNTNVNGWTLLGNPFMQDIDWDKISKSNLSNAVYVYDPASGWKTWNGATGSLTNGVIGVMNAFFVQTFSSGPTISISDTARTGTQTGFAGKRAGNEIADFSLKLTDKHMSANQAWFQFSEDGLPEYDAGDAVQLVPLNPGQNVLASVLNDSVSLDINHLPIGFERLEIPLHAQTVSNEVHQIHLDNNNLPEGWSITLIDHKTEHSTALDKPYSFEASEQVAKSVGTAGLQQPQTVQQEAVEARFTVVIETGETVDAENPLMPETFSLEQNYPNPFNPVTTITYSLAEPVEVQLEVFNMLGQHVHTLVNSKQQAGKHSATFDANRLSSGVYIYRLRAGNFTQTRKLTLIK